MKLILLGPPGSGKGTVAKRLAQEFGLAHLSTGDLFREEIAKNSEIGKKAKEYMDKGIWVPDEITMDIIKNKLDDNFVLDGFPRTIPQAEALDQLAKVDMTINLEISKEQSIERISGRRTCSGCGAIYHVKYMPPKKEGVCDKCGGDLVQRSDQTEDVVKTRFEQHHEKTEPLLKYYGDKGLLKKVDGSGTPDEVYALVKKEVES
ncbi:MAG: adenylate kinase [Nanoarchaeota archaeon]|nr:adenylate kinase [Nanoarchaeota archaeon]